MEGLNKKYNLDGKGREVFKREAHVGRVNNRAALAGGYV